MGNIKTPSHEEEQVLYTPDSAGCSDLRQSPAHPDLDGIAEQQCHADNGCEDLLENQHTFMQRQSIGMNSIPSKSEMRQFLLNMLIHNLLSLFSWPLPRGKHTDVNIALTRLWNIHNKDETQGPDVSSSQVFGKFPITARGANSNTHWHGYRRERCAGSIR